MKVPTEKMSSLGGPFLGGFVKYLEEKALARVPMIGNANIRSGIVKLGIGMGISAFGDARKWYVQAPSYAFGIDGTEDILTALFKGQNLLGSGNSREVEVM